MACIIASLAMAACGGSSAVSPSGEISSYTAITSQLNQLNSDLVTLNNAQQVDTERCMHELELVYYPQITSLGSGPWGAPTEDPSSLAAAETAGYGLYAPMLAAAQRGNVNPNEGEGAEQRYEDSLRGTISHRYSVALVGAGAKPVNYNVPGIGEFSTSPKGCVSTTERAIFGSFANSVILGNAPGFLESDWETAQSSDSKLIALNHKWARCMATRGLHAKDPGALFNAISLMYAKVGPSNKVHQQELKAASADFICEASVSYVKSAEEDAGADAKAALSSAQSIVLKADQAVAHGLAYIRTHDLKSQ